MDGNRVNQALRDYTDSIRQSLNTRLGILDSTLQVHRCSVNYLPSGINLISGKQCALECSAPHPFLN